MLCKKGGGRREGGSLLPTYSWGDEDRMNKTIEDTYAKKKNQIFIKKTYYNKSHFYTNAL